MDNIDEILDKYNDNVLNNLDRDNMNKIIYFLEQEKCEYIDELIEDYLDLFTIEYNEFIDKYNKLNNKYDGKYLELVSSDMDYLEEFYME